MIYAGRGPTVAFMRDAGHPRAGVAVDYRVDTVAEAMLDAAMAPLSPAERGQLAEWSARAFSLPNIAGRVVEASLAVAAP